MQANSPHYLLFSEASGRTDQRRHWRFVLRSVSGDQSLAATDIEPGTDSGRLELLAVVRGLEALDQPSRVTLLTRSRYVSRAVRRGLGQWRDRQWRWERFGTLVPIRDHDLWRRLDHALRIHQVECCPWHFDDLRPMQDDAAAAGTGFASDQADDAAVLIVPRRLRSVASHDRPRRPMPWRVLERLRQAVAALWAATARLAPAGRPGTRQDRVPGARRRRRMVGPWRPAFTRAA